MPLVVIKTYYHPVIDTLVKNKIARIRLKKKNTVILEVNSKYVVSVTKDRVAVKKKPYAQNPVSDFVIFRKSNPHYEVVEISEEKIRFATRHIPHYGSPRK